MMRSMLSIAHGIAIVAIVVPVSLSGCAHLRIASSGIEAEEQRVLAVEDECVAAEVSRDEETLQGLVDNRLVIKTSGGVTSGKEELIQHVLELNDSGGCRDRTVRAMVNARTIG